MQTQELAVGKRSGGRLMISTRLLSSYLKSIDHASRARMLFQLTGPNDETEIVNLVREKRAPFQIHCDFCLFQQI